MAFGTHNRPSRAGLARRGSCSLTMACPKADGISQVTTRSTGLGLGLASPSPGPCRPEGCLEAGWGVGWSRMGWGVRKPKRLRQQEHLCGQSGIPDRAYVLQT